MSVITQSNNGMIKFRVRSRDKCTNYECKQNALTACGIAESNSRYYKVITVCDLCGTFYAFLRFNRRVTK